MILFSLFNAFVWAWIADMICKRYMNKWDNEYKRKDEMLRQYCEKDMNDTNERRY